MNVEEMKCRRTDLKRQLREQSKLLKLEMRKRRRLIRAAGRLSAADLEWLMKQQQPSTAAAGQDEAPVDAQPAAEPGGRAKPSCRRATFHCGREQPAAEEAQVASDVEDYQNAAEEVDDTTNK
ncbi:unnamed protein product [Effrenium voratum]|uniref:Uncharacterized protein n=1 Tax=Effrenium voratum TaxID=2562239 RepID=A0AA36JSX0_9DINO|nr:unnamed protein product [Effrenium voratum]